MILRFQIEIKLYNKYNLNNCFKNGIGIKKDEVKLF